MRAEKVRSRRFAQAPISDEEEDAPPCRNSTGDERVSRRKRKLVHFPDEDEEEEPKVMVEEKKKNEEPEAEAGSDNEEQAQPIGEVIRVSGKGRGRRNHYESFEYNGHQYGLEDPVLVHHEKENQKPYVAIIKDIAQTRKGAMMITGQWFYRPEEAEKKGGGNWELRDTRELFYSFHRDEVPAESVFHKCVVHFIPKNKQIPHRHQHPGFIVQKVYDTEQRRLFKLTDKDYEENKQHEIDLMVQKTLARLVDLPDLPLEDTDVNNDDPLKSKRVLRRNKSSLDVSREDEGLRSLSLKPESPGNTAASSSEYYAILSRFKVLTGETHRDKWLEKILQSVQFICTPAARKQNDGEERCDSDIRRSPSNKSCGSDHINGSESSDDKTCKSDAFDWPDSAVPAVAALEEAAHHALSADFQKYNQKMRQLAFNLKSNGALARRFLNRVLDPAQILNMLPYELKEGLTAEEIASRKPDELCHLQMTDARCNRCMEKQVGLIDIIRAGHGDRYQLECVACGNTWYASRDDASALIIEGPSSTKTVGIAPLATAKFEDVKKNMVSPKGSTDAPVLGGSQKSVDKPHSEENPSGSINPM